MYCKNCGYKLKEGQKFCPKCGTPVTVMTGQGQRPGAGMNASDAGARPPKKRNKGVIIAAGTAAAVIVIVIIAIIVIRSQNAGDETTMAEAQVQEEEEEKEQAEEEAEAEEETGTEDEAEEEAEAAAGTDAATPGNGITVFDISVTDFPYTYSDNSGTTQGQLATGTIKNDNDEAYTVTISYDFEGVYRDSYGEEHPITGSDPHDYNVPAHSTYSIYTALTTDQEYDYYYLTEYLMSYTNYTGNYDTASRVYYDDVGGVPLSVDEITDVHDYYIGTQTYLTLEITLPNTTGVDWQSSWVEGVIFYKGVYYDSFLVASGNIKAGEDGVLEVDSELFFGYNAQEMYDDLLIIPTDAAYYPETDQ